MKQSDKYLHVESLKEASMQLQNLQTFAPDVFADATTSYDQAPNLSSFILMLAVVHTEIKNLCFFRSWLSGQKPEGERTGRTKELGEFSGLSGYLFRLTIATVAELLKKIHDHAEVLESKEFRKLYAQLSKDHKRDWDNLVKAAMGITVKGTPYRTLKEIRDKVVSHFDLRHLALGYIARFAKAEADEDRPFVSIGNSQIQSRFYFADAAAEGYIAQELGDKDISSLNDRLHDILDHLNCALFSLVNSFIQSRSAYRQYRTTSS